MWLTVIDIDRFNVDTALTPIYGFRVNNDGGADLKLIGASDQPFVAAPAGGGPLAIRSGTWSGAGTTWSAPYGTGTVTATISAPPGTLSNWARPRWLLRAIARPPSPIVRRSP